MIGLVLAGGDQQGVGGRDRRSAIGEGADARKRVVGRACQRRADEDESKGKNEGEGSHLTVSGFAAGVGPPFRWPPDNQPMFPAACAKAENGFVARANCFVEIDGRNNSYKTQLFQYDALTEGDIAAAWKSPAFIFDPLVHWPKSASFNGPSQPQVDGEREPKHWPCRLISKNCNF